MSSIVLPDSVITWETEEATDYKAFVSTFTVRAMVGPLAIFVRRYVDDDDLAGDDEYAYDLDDAKDKAARTLAAGLQKLLQGVEW